jgi:hypothetical protein
MLKRHLDAAYSPLYFLAALGAGGLVPSFFMYPMFMIKHPETPMVTFEALLPVLNGNNGMAASVLLTIALTVIVFFALLHFRLLFWNIREYRRYRKTDAYKTLRNSNSEVQLMAIPLTLAMSVNVAFILGALFVPGLWGYVEYLFPVAMLAFGAIGIYALKILGEYFTRVITTGNFNCAGNNNLGQMLAVFSLAMIAVGFAAPGAMSHTFGINAAGIAFSIFFLSLAVLLGIVKLVLGIRAIFEHGISEAASPSLWILIPILTLSGITIIRLIMGLHHGFETDVSYPALFVLTAVVISLQVLFGMIGYSVMKKLGYFRDYLSGEKKDAGSFALICPGVAFFVFGVFFISFGLVKNGILEHQSLSYFLSWSPLVLIQAVTVVTLFRLTRRLLRCQGAECRA